MSLPDNTSLNVVLVKGTHRLRYRIEPCGQSEWIATVEDVSNGRNLDTIRLPNADAARVTYVSFNRAIDIAVGTGRWKAVSTGGESSRSRD